MNMTYSKTGEALTEGFEGCRLTAYQDVAGVWTIGYGTTGPDVVEGLVITQDEAVVRLEKGIAWAESAVNRLVTVALTQPEFDALALAHSRDLPCSACSTPAISTALQISSSAGTMPGVWSWPVCSAVV